MLSRGIKQKLVFSLLLTTLLLLTTFFIILDRYLKDHSIEETEKTISFLGENASSLLRKPLFSGDYKLVENIANSIFLDEFDYMVIYDNSIQDSAFTEDKNNLYELLKLQETLKDKTDVERKTLSLDGEPYTQYLFPILSQGLDVPLGYLIIGVSVDKTRSQLEGITDRILLVSVLLFVSFTVTTYFLADRIVKPIKQLSAKLGAFASGDNSARSDIRTNDEIKDLSDNFNFMADKINEQILSIEQYSKNLEKMVEERTEELLKALDAIKEKDNRLSRAEKINSLNSIVSSIAHEINNPLAIISGNIQLIEARADDSFIQKRLKTANDAVSRIANLIDEINFFSAIKDIATLPLTFGQVLSCVLENVMPDSVNLKIDGCDDDQIQSNSHLLSISLENIINNAVQMIRSRDLGSEGKINIRYYRDTPYFIVEISDNAGGFEEPDKVFEPFYTTFNEKKGLGLTLVFHAIQALNGEIKVKNLDNGASITIMLPIEVDEEDTGQWQL